MGRTPLQQPKYKCACCGTEYETVKGHYYTSFSPMYKDTGRLHTCNTCVQRIYTDLVKKYESEHDALRRTCMMFDLCFSEKLFQLSEKRNINSNRMGKYMSLYNMSQYKMSGKTFEDTLEEEKSQKVIEAAQNYYDTEIEVDEDTGKFDMTALRKKWGSDYDEEEYLAMEDHYNMLSSKIDDDDIVQQQLIMDLCDIKIQERRCRIKGDFKGVKDFKQLYQSTLGTANLKPKDNSANLDTDQCIVMDAAFIEKYTPCDIYTDTDLFKDFDYIERFIERPRRNLVNNTNVMDKEFCVKDGDDNDKG